MPVRLATARIAASFALAAAVMPATLIGCGDAATLPSAASDDAAFQIVRRLRFDYVSGTAAELARYRYQRDTQTVSRGATGDTLGYERMRTHFDGDGGTVVDTVYRGRFPAGLISRLFAPHSDAVPDSVSFKELVPRDPAYLAPRNRYAYAYRTMSVGGHPAVEVVLQRPDEVESDLVRAFFRYERGTEQVTALVVERAHDSWIATSSAHVAVTLAPRPDGTWLPQALHVEEKRDAPLQREYHVEKDVRFSDYVPRGSPAVRRE